MSVQDVTSDLKVIFHDRDVIASLNLSPTPPVELGGTPPLYSSEGLEVLAGKKALEKEDVMALLARITDNSRCNFYLHPSCRHLIRFFEFKAMFGGNLICGFGRLYGQLTGFLVNSGPITAGDSQKGGHFVQVKIVKIWIKPQLYPH